MLPFEGGKIVSVGSLVSQIEDSAKHDSIEGITLLGGEPFAHAESAAILATQTRRRGMSVMIFSGYTIEQMRDMPDPAVETLLAETDLLVDGPYESQLPDTSHRWIGSSNQRIHFLSNRYSPDDPCWSAADTLEIRLENDEVSVNGFPAASAAGLWKRL